MLRSCRGRRKKEKRNELGTTEQQHLQVSFIAGLAEEPSAGRAVDELKVSEEQLKLII